MDTFDGCCWEWPLGSSQSNLCLQIFWCHFQIYQWLFWKDICINPSPVLIPIPWNRHYFLGGQQWMLETVMNVHPWCWHLHLGTWKYLRWGVLAKFMEHDSSANCLIFVISDRLIPRTKCIVVQILIAHGANTDAQDYGGRTALIWASSLGQLVTVEVGLIFRLVEHGFCCHKYPFLTLSKCSKSPCCTFDLG